MYRSQKTNNLPPVTMQFPFLSTGTNLIQALCRSKTHNNTKQAFDRIRQYSLKMLQKSTQFAQVLNKITSRKDLIYKKFLFAVLYQVKISDILAKRQKLNLLKEKSKSSSSSLIGSILTKNLKTKTLQTFNEMKSKSLLIKQRNTFKTLNLMNSVKSLELKLLRKSFKSIKVEAFTLLAKYKRCFVIERFWAKKRIQNLAFALAQLRNKPLKVPQKQIETISTQQSQPQQADILKELEEQKKQLQAELNQLKATNRTNLKVKESELQKMQSEYESMRFNFDIIAQENSELGQSINERQKLSLEAESRKKQHEQNMQIKRSTPQRANRFNEHEIWKNVFDNLMCYLYKLKSGYDQQVFSVEKLLQKMTEPLISLSVYAERADLEQENEVLRDLLNSYQAAFNKSPSEEFSQKTMPLPLDLLNKQRRYLYLALDCLTRWGTTEAQGLEQIKSVLDKIKDRQQSEALSAN